MRKIIWGLMALMFITTAVALQFVPDIIPAHYDATGEITRWGSKNELFILPAMTLFFVVLLQLITFFFERRAKNSPFEKEKAECRTNIKVLNLATIGMEVMFTIMGGWFLWTAKAEAESSATHAIMGVNFGWIIMGLLFIFLGNIMPKTRMNGVIGVRTEWSMFNEVTWAKSNRFGGYVFIVTGVLMMLVALVFNNTAALVINLLILLISVFVVMAYSYRVYMEEQK